MKSSSIFILFIFASDENRSIGIIYFLFFKATKDVRPGSPPPAGQCNTSAIGGERGALMCFSDWFMLRDWTLQLVNGEEIFVFLDLS